LYDFYQARIDDCDVQIEQALAVLKADKPEPEQPIPKARHRTKQPNAVNFDVRTALYQLIGVDLTQIHGIGPFLALRLIAECGTDLSKWPTAHLRLAAVTVGRTNTALGAFYRRLAARIGKAKAVTATARKIAVLFYNAMRFGMYYSDPGADQYEQKYRERVIKQLHRRAAEFGFVLQEAEGVS
jgi:hypothetical protein